MNERKKKKKRNNKKKEILKLKSNDIRIIEINEELIKKKTGKQWKKSNGWQEINEIK